MLSTPIMEHGNKGVAQENKRLLERDGKKTLFYKKIEKMYHGILLLH